MKSYSNPKLWRITARWPGEDIFEEYEYFTAEHAAAAVIGLHDAGWIVSIKLET